MRKHLITIILTLIAISSIILILNPYHFDSRAVDYASDLIFENQVKLNNADIVLDYSENKILNNTLYGRITVHYDITAEEPTRVALPLATKLNNNDYSSTINKNVEIKVNGADAIKDMYYGENIKAGANLSDYSYKKLDSLKYISDYEDKEFFAYDYSNMDIILGLNYSSIEEASIFYFGMKKLTTKDLFILKLKNQIPEGLDSINKALFKVDPNSKAYIISSIKLSSIGLSVMGEETRLGSNEELYEFIINNLSSNKENVNIDDTVVALENEINEMLDINGLHYFSVDEVINKSRLSIYEFEVPAGSSAIEFSYNSFAGLDTRYNVPYYEASFKLNKKNFSEYTSFKATYKLSDENKYLNFSTIEWEKIEGGYQYINSTPKEIKIFFSSVEAPIKSFETLTILISGFIKYLIIPALIALLFIILLIRLFNYYKERRIKLLPEIKRISKLAIAYIPEALTFYLVGFKFYTLYTGFSGIDEINILLTLIFIILCAIYIIFKTIKKISWIKLTIFSILAIILTILALDPAFVLLIALALCYIDKGEKPFLRAMYISIALFSVLTITLNALEIVTDEAFYMWISLEQGSGVAGQIRYSLGFSHPNTVGLFVFIGVLCYILYQEKTSNVSRLFILLICASVFFLTRSRTSTFSILILVVLDILSDYIKFKGKWRYVFALMFPLFAILSWYIIQAYGVEYDTKIDAFLSHRPFYIYDKYLKDFNYLSFKGVSIIDGYPVDNLYMNVLVLEGPIAFIIYTAVYILASIYVIKTKNTKYLFALGVYLLFCMFEATLMCYACATFVGLYFIATLRRKNKEKINA